jgi:hypothetical protein
MTLREAFPLSLMAAATECARLASLAMSVVVTSQERRGLDRKLILAGAIAELIRGGSRLFPGGRGELLERIHDALEAGDEQVLERDRMRAEFAS